MAFLAMIAESRSVQILEYHGIENAALITLTQLYLPLVHLHHQSWSNLRLHYLLKWQVEVDQASLYFILQYLGLSKIAVPDLIFI